MKIQYFKDLWNIIDLIKITFSGRKERFSVTNSFPRIGHFIWNKLQYRSKFQYWNMLQYWNITQYWKIAAEQLYAGVEPRAQNMKSSLKPTRNMCQYWTMFENWNMTQYWNMIQYWIKLQ